MSAPAKVSIIGNTQAYVNVRAAVLQHFWLVETVALDAGEVPLFAAELMVLCASIAAEEQQDWVDRARVKRPHILIVRMDGFNHGPLAGADAMVDDGEGPGALVSTIYELLTERGLESREWPEIPDGGWVQ
jgi:hypothetical protein